VAVNIRLARPPRSGLGSPIRDLLLQPVERIVESTGRRIPAGAFPDLFTNGHAIGIVLEAENGEKDNLFEFSENRNGGSGHLNYILVKIVPPGK
jgi:hypothetical protein